MTDPETEVERLPASPEPDRKSQESNRKSHEQLPVPSNPYNSNLGPILHRFGDIAGFVFMTPSLFHPNFAGVPVE